MRSFILLAVTLSLLLLTSCQQEVTPLAAQEMQVAWGATVYRLECARCHDPDRAAPVLQAETLISYRNAHNLFEYTRRTMRLDKPGALPEPYYWDVTAFMLAANGMLNLPADTALGPETAEQVNFVPE
jgi:hypothetical protein